MAIFLTLPQQVQKNKNDIKELKESEIVLDNYIPKIDKGFPLGVATLDENGLVPSEQLPANPGNFLPLSGGTMSGTLHMDGNIITDAAYIEVFDLHATQIFSGSGFQDVQFLSNIDLNSEHKIIGAVKGSGLTDMATIENIKDHDESPFSHPDIRNSISALQGAWVLRGVVQYQAADVTPTRLSDRIQILLNRAPLLGDVLQDLDSHEWYFNGTNWDDFGQLHIGLASPTSDGLMSIAQYNKLTGLQTGPQIEALVKVQSDRIDTLVPIVADKEDEINKVTDFTAPNNTTFPTTLAVSNYVNDEINLIPPQIDAKIKDVGLDTPIEELGNKSLKTYFEDENLIPTSWSNRANTTHAFVNDELVVTASADGATIGVQKETSYNGNYYYAVVFKSDSLNTFFFAQATTPLDVLQVNTFQQNSSVKSFSADSTLRLYQSLLAGQTFTVKHAVFRQTDLSQDRIDYWFNVYREIKEKSTTQYLLESPNKRLLNLPIAELNNHSLIEVFEGIIKNPTFDKGSADWTLTGTGSVSNGIYTFVVPYQYGNLRQIAPLSYQNNKLYIVSRFKADSDQVVLLSRGNSSNASVNQVAHSGSNNFEIKSMNWTNTTDQTARFSIVDNRTNQSNSFSNIEVDYLYVANQTALGITNLSKSQMDYWFNVYQALIVSDTNAIFSVLAPKQQEEWITPTLINGAVNTSENDFNKVQYFKDNFGIVHLRGVMNFASSSYSSYGLVLANGYRPNKLLKLLVSTATGTGKLYVNSGGQMWIITSDATEVSLESITFRAEA